MPARKPEASKAVVGMPDFKWLEDPGKAQLPTKTILKTTKKAETHHSKNYNGVMGGMSAQKEEGMVTAKKSEKFTRNHTIIYLSKLHTIM